MSRLTHKKKIEDFPIIIERDGYVCFYCSGEFTQTHPTEFDHLNNDDNDSRPENLVLVHHECNVKKSTYAEWQIKAHEKLLQNERALLASERRLADTGTTDELTASQYISKILRPIALQWLEEHLIVETEILLRDAVTAIVNLCQNQVGWGSQASIRRYIEEWTNPYNGRFTISTNEQGKAVIRRRTEN